MTIRRGLLMIVVALAAEVAVSCTSASDEAAVEPVSSSPARPEITSTPRRSAAPAATPFTPAPQDEVPKPTYDLHQGMEVWAVYFIATSYGDPEFRQMIDTLKAIGYKPSSGDVGCDQGARAGLGLNRKQNARVALYFTSQDAAVDFAARVEPRPIGTVRVKLFCLD